MVHSLQYILAAASITVLLAATAKPVNVCSLPVDRGPCRAFIPRFYYDSQSGACQQFIYGGCRGNANRFHSKQECESACAPAKPADPDICSLPADKGPCLAILPAFYYNSQNGACQMFEYGGCEGNGNRFGTQKECLFLCTNNK